jgi:hypothetical protein
VVVVAGGRCVKRRGYVRRCRKSRCRRELFKLAKCLWRGVGAQRRNVVSLSVAMWGVDEIVDEALSFKQFPR